MRYFIALIALLMCMQLSGHTKRALIICVNEQEDTSWPQINAGNDLKSVKKHSITPAIMIDLFLLDV